MNESNIELLNVLVAEHNSRHRNPVLLHAGRGLPNKGSHLAIVEILDCYPHRGLTRALMGLDGEWIIIRTFRASWEDPQQMELVGYGYGRNEKHRRRCFPYGVFSGKDNELTRRKLPLDQGAARTGFKSFMTTYVKALRAEMSKLPEPDHPEPKDCRWPLAQQLAGTGRFGRLRCLSGTETELTAGSADRRALATLLGRLV